MRKFTFNIGDQYNDFTIISEDSKVINGHLYVFVRCKCGKEFWKCLSDLKRGKTKSCINCGARRRSKTINIGDKYKCWTVISGPISSKYQNLLYEVKCDCGNTKLMTSWELLNPNKRKECTKCAGKERGRKQLINNGMVGELTKTKFSKLKRVAKARNIPFNLTMNQLWDLYVNQNGLCALTGDVIDDINAASLDRIDSTKDYDIDNVQWVTVQANLSKHIMSVSDFIEFCKKVINHANQQPSRPLTKSEGSETNN